MYVVKCKHLKVKTDKRCNLSISLQHIVLFISNVYTVSHDNDWIHYSVCIIFPHSPSQFNWFGLFFFICALKLRCIQRSLFSCTLKIKLVRIVYGFHSHFFPIFNLKLASIYFLCYSHQHSCKFFYFARNKFAFVFFFLHSQFVAHKINIACCRVHFRSYQYSLYFVFCLIFDIEFTIQLSSTYSIYSMRK